MQDKRDIENVVQEIMGLMDDIIGCDSAGYQFECRRQIQSKLRELVESKLSPEDQYINDIVVWHENVNRAVKEAANVADAYDHGVLDTLTTISSVNQKGGNMQENLIRLHSIILDGDLTEAAKLCDELIAAHHQSVERQAITSTEQPEALRLASVVAAPKRPAIDLRNRVAAELRRLHARVQELEAQTAHNITQEKQGCGDTK